jgi:triacylglycerol esterase/lipase EstA (alpha/beta hydrolase family)
MPLTGPGKPFGDPLRAVTPVITTAQSANSTLAAAATVSRIGAALTAAPGIDDFESRPSEAHPRPVVLVHGTFGDAAGTWLVAAPMFAAAGYSVFRLDYGMQPGVPLLHGIASIEESAKQLAAFVDKVLAATGADKVDIVGHSQGGMMPRYYLKFLGGAAKVNQLIALAPSNHGTTVGGMTALAQEFPGAPELMNVACPAAAQQIAGSDFLIELNEGGDTVPGVRYTVIATKYDLTVTPYTSCWLTGPEVRNILLQDLWPTDPSGHVATTYDPIALREVLNTLGATTPAIPAGTRTNGAMSG